MTARPSSPTSLLWAHQLKREHGYLLSRVKDLEANDERQNKRLKTVETAAKAGANADISALTKQIKALEEGVAGNRLAKLENEFKQRTKDLEVGTESITMQIAGMQKEGEERDEEKRKAFTKEKALLKRIGDLETGLNTYEQSLAQMGRRVDDGRLEQIRGQLEGLTKQVQSEGSQMKMLAQSVTALEAVNDKLQKSNQELAAQLADLAASPAPAVDAVAAEDIVADEGQPAKPSSAPAPHKSKKKSHRWSGGGADRDIVKSGAELFGDIIPTAPVNQPRDSLEPEEPEEQVPKQTRPPPKRKPKSKPIPPHLRVPSSDGPKKKSHKWAGGGADRDIIEAAKAQSSSRPSRATQAPQPAVVRSGRGWYEVVEPAGDSDLPAGAAPRSQSPKKRIATPHWTVQEAFTQGRSSRRPKQQLAAVKAEDGDEQAVPAIAPGIKTKKPVSKPAPETAARKRKRGPDDASAAEVMASPGAPQAAPARRRRILQDD